MERQRYIQTAITNEQYGRLKNFCLLANTNIKHLLRKLVKDFLSANVVTTTNENSSINSKEKEK